MHAALPIALAFALAGVASAVPVTTTSWADPATAGLNSSVADIHRRGSKHVDNDTTALLDTCPDSNHKSKSKVITADGCTPQDLTDSGASYTKRGKFDFGGQNGIVTNCGLAAGEKGPSLGVSTSKELSRSWSLTFDESFEFGPVTAEFNQHVDWSKATATVKMTDYQVPDGYTCTYAYTQTFQPQTATMKLNFPDPVSAGTTDGGSAHYYWYVPNIKTDGLKGDPVVAPYCVKTCNPDGNTFRYDM